MELIEQKKRVANWMGAEKISVGPNMLRYVFPNSEIAIFIEDEWNPQDNDAATCKDWREIWGDMDADSIGKYFFNLGLPQAWELHTTTPSQRWEALNKTLDEMGVE